MQEKMNELHSKMAAVLHIPNIKEIKLAEDAKLKDVNDRVIGRVVSLEHDEDNKGVNAVLEVDPNAYPEWLAEAADLEWDELTDWQRQWFENYRAYLEEQHKGLAVTPKNPMSLAQKMAQELKAVEPEAKKVIHFMGYDAHGSKGPGVYCSCGMFKLHRRGKVLAAWADKHYEKYGHYWKRS